MSTQLILYPQTYDGTTTFSSVEFVADGIIFNSINSSTSYTSALYQTAFLTANPPSAVNTWYRYRTNTASLPALPIESGNNLILNSVVQTGVNFSITGVYQELSNLTIGASYTVRVNITSVAGSCNLAIINRNTYNFVTSLTTTTATTQITKIFTAQTTHDIVWVAYLGQAAVNLTISSISVAPTATAPSEIYSDLADGQVICDLYQEEDIPLTLSVDDFKNVAEKIQSYSKDFNLPATKRNNQIFNNMFEVTRSDDGLIFNPYAKTKCVLKQDGFILFEGSLRLIDVKDKEGEISYSVNLYSEVIALADTLKDSTFCQLDFSELNHLYNKDSIKQSWTSGLPLINPLTDPNAFAGAVGATSTQVLKYPFIDWTGQIGISNSANPTGPTQYFPELTRLEQAFRPTIKLKYLINKIFAAAGFNYTSDFFDSADFGNLFMDFNWGGNSMPSAIDETIYPATLGISPYVNVGSSYQALQLYADGDPTGYGSSTSFLPPDYNTSGADAFSIVSTSDDALYTIKYDFSFSSQFSGVTNGTATTCRWKKETAAGVVTSIDESSFWVIYGNVAHWTGTINVVLNTGDKLTPQSKEIAYGGATYNLLRYNKPSSATFTVGTSEVNTTILNTLRCDLGQWDFLKCIFTMFNLVTMADNDNPNNILIQPYSDVFIKNTNSGTTGNLTLAARSIEHDWTDKIDVSQMELMPLTDLNKETIFKFVEDDDDFAFNLYKGTTGKLYGSREFESSAQSAVQTTMLEGTKEIIAEPFAATVSKPLYQQFPLLLVPCVYSRTDDGSFEGFDNSPRIFYDNGEVDSNITYYIPPQNGLSSENQSDFLQFSHLSTIPTQASTVDFYFGNYGYIDPIGASVVDNLFSLYWQPYFNELYNPDTRTMTLKVNLTPADINTFKFYDVVFIKNRSFRVNKIDYKPNDLATVEFILIS